MRRNLKALALSVLGVLAFGALYASAAQAEGNFRAESYPATVSATPTNQNAWAINGGTVTVTCSGTSLTDVMTSTSSAIELSPSYSGCQANGGTTVAIKANGCTYGWAIDQLSGAGGASGSQTINCPAGKEIEIARYLGAELRCLYALPAQGPNGTVAYQNQGSGSTATVEAALNVGMQGKVLLGAAFYCGKGAGNPISVGYTGDMEISTLNEVGEPTGLSAGSAGLYLAGKESAEPAQQPRFESETGADPLAIEGSTSKAHYIDLNIRRLECSSVTFKGELIGSASELPLEAQYEGCRGNGNTPATVSMNSCHYVLNVLNVGPPYAGSLDLACAKEGDGIGLTFFTSGGSQICEIKLPAQEGLGSVALQTLGSGFDRHIAADFAISGLRYQRTSGTAANCGSLNGTNGTYTGGSTLIGL